MARFVRFPCALVTPICVLGIAATAAAQGAPALQEAPDDLADSEARGLYNAGQSAYLAGRYTDALAHFQRAYELSRRPEMLFNIGTAAERCREDQVALDAYRHYLEAIPDAPNRDVTERRIAFLEEQLAKRPTEPKEPEPENTLDEPRPQDAPRTLPTQNGDTEPPRASPDPEGKGGVSPVPWILVGVGAALVATGSALLGVGVSDKSTVEDPPEGARWAESADAYDRGPKLLASGSVLLPLGVALAATGLAWAVTGDRSDESVSFQLSPSGAVVRGKF